MYPEMGMTYWLEQEKNWLSEADDDID